MFEIIGIIYFVLAIIDYIMKTGEGDIHVGLALLFIIASMVIKTRSETVKISNYIEKKSGATKHEKAKEETMCEFTEDE